MRFPGITALCLLPLVLAIGGCAYRKAASSGETGCSPSEIQISDRSIAGTWTATCHGDVYYCSIVGGAHCTPAGNDLSSPPFSANAAENSEPTASLEDSQEEGGAKDEEPGEISTKPVPSEALGYSFGATVDETQAACIQAGHSWEGSENDPARFQCSGTPADVGLSASSRLDFCDGKLCSLMVYLKLEAERSDSTAKFQRIVDALQKKFGQPSFRMSEVPDDCKDQLLRCVAEGRAKWKAAWHWQHGDQVAMATYLKNQEVFLAIRYKVSETGDLNTDAF